MKITDFALICIVALVPISVSMDIDQGRGSQAAQLRQRYSEMMNTASEDAALAMLEQKSGSGLQMILDGYKKNPKEIEPNLDKALERFYRSIYVNLGIDEDKVAQDAFKQFLPVQVIVAYEGYYIHTLENAFNISSGRNENTELWLPKKPYSYYDSGGNRIFNFTLDNHVHVYDCSTGAGSEGDGSTMLSNFDTIRRQTIVSQIQKDLEYYTARANFVSKTYGKGYVYNIPYIPDDTWHNTIDDVCFMSFLQGMALPGTDEAFNTFGAGGTRVMLKSKIYGNTDAVSGVKYYHRSSTCSSVTGAVTVFENRREAAKNGYYPCGTCNP
jgi:hypothetical protein